MPREARRVGLLQVGEQFIFPELLQGLGDGAADTDLAIKIQRVYPGQEFEDVLRDFRAEGLVGVLVNSPALQGSFLEALRAASVSYCAINIMLPTNCVYMYEAEAGDRLFDALVAAGHRRIAFYAEVASSRHYSWRERLAAYRRGMARLGEPPRIVHPVDMEFGDEEGKDAPRERLRTLFAPPRPTALITYNAGAALNAIQAAREVHGLRVPEDLSVATYISDRVMDDCGGYDLSCVRVPLHGMGEASVRCMAAHLDAGRTDTPAVLVPCGPLEGDTIRPPRSDRAEA